MSNPITRRAALAVPLTLPLLPVTAYAAPDDPAVKAYEEWRAAFDAYDNRPNNDDAPMAAAHDVEFAARLALADATPTTAAGLALQIRFAFSVFGEVSHDSLCHNLDAYEFHNWAENLEGRLLRSMLTYAVRMAGVPS